MKTPRALAASLVAALAGTAYAQPDLVANGDFETGDFSGWTQFGDMSFTAVAGIFNGVEPHGGAFAAHFGPTGGPGGIMQTLSATPGQTVLVEFWYQAQGNDNFFDCSFDGVSLISFTNDLDHTEWTYFSFPVVVNGSSPVLQFSFENPPDYDYLDDVHVNTAGFGACCLPDGSCTIATSAGCTGRSGIYRGDGSVCATTNCNSLGGACCLVNGSCVVTTAPGCALQNGIFRGQGAACATANCPVASYTPIPLNYNFNGLVHGATEQGTQNRDNPNGYRSIADRGLLLDGNPGSLNAGPLADPDGIPFTVVTQPLTLDIVHLGDRQFVANGARAWGTGTNNGLQPTWLPISDQTTPQVTNVSALHATFTPQTSLAVLYQVSDAGGHFDVKLTFTDQSNVTVTLFAPDWFGPHTPPAPTNGVAIQRQLGTYNSTENTDVADLAATPLNVIEGVVSVMSLHAAGLGDFTGKTLASISFQNPISNANYPNSTPANGSGFAIIAATLAGATTGGPTCYANCDHSTQIPFLNVNDFICFQQKFAGGDTYANCDGSTAPPILNVNDFICFQQRFAAGCTAP
jgi:hypothetical protein